MKMHPENHYAIIVSGGHIDLMAFSYLVKAGKSVLFLKARDELGRGHQYPQALLLTSA